MIPGRIRFSQDGDDLVCVTGKGPRGSRGALRSTVNKLQCERGLPGWREAKWAENRQPPLRHAHPQRHKGIEAVANLGWHARFRRSGSVEFHRDFHQQAPNSQWNPTGATLLAHARIFSPPSLSPSTRHPSGRWSVADNMVLGSWVRPNIG